MVKKRFRKPVPVTITIIQSKMSSYRDDEDMDGRDSENESKYDDNSYDFLKMNDQEVCPTQADYDRFKQQWNEERRKLKAVREKLESDKKKRLVNKKIICIRKLPSKMRLPEVKEAMMQHTLREKMVCNLKIIDASILPDGVIVGRVMKQAGVRTDEDRKNYRRHFELAITKTIGEFRNNYIRKLRNTFMGKRDDLTVWFCTKSF